MPAEHRLHRWSWLFISAGTIRTLIVPAVAAIVASGGVLLWRPELLSLVMVVPLALYGLIRQWVYSYRFADDGLIVRDGLLSRNVRHIPYERIHNVALVRNPLHRALGVTTVRIETAAGGRPEAVMRVLAVEAAEAVRRHTLGEDREIAATIDSIATRDGLLLETPDRELVLLGLLSNRGFLVVAAVLGAVSQGDWWHAWVTNQTRSAFFSQEQGPRWTGWLLESLSVPTAALLGLAAVLLFIALLRLLSVVWYLVRYRGFTLERRRDDLRAEYGFLTRVSSIIPVHRIQLVTVTMPLLHRWSGRRSIEVETAGASDDGSGLSGQLAATGIKLTRQWLAPIVSTERSSGLIRQVMPEIDLDAVPWKPIQGGAVRRIVFRSALAMVPVAAAVMAVLAFAPSPVHALHGLWVPAVGLPAAWLIARRWVRNAGWALTDDAIYFRSGWPGRNTSVVRLGSVQTASMKTSPFDRRSGMATLAVDTAGAGTVGHRIQIPYLDATVAAVTLRRLYTAGCATEFRW